MTVLYDQIARIAHWGVAGGLLLLFLVLAQGFKWRNEELNVEKTFDGRYWYTPTDATELLAKMGDKGRGLYVATQLTLDVVFPVVYGTMFAVLIVLFFERQVGATLLVFPLLNLTFDLLENLSTSFLTLTCADKKDPPFAYVCAVFSASKWTFAGLSAAALAVGLVLWVIRGVFKA